MKLSWQEECERLRSVNADLLAALIYARERLAAYVGIPVDHCIGGEFAPINAAIAKARETP